MIRYRLLGHHRTVVRSAHGPIGRACRDVRGACPSPAPLPCRMRAAAWHERGSVRSRRAMSIYGDLYESRIEAPEEPRTGVGGEPRRHLRTRRYLAKNLRNCAPAVFCRLWLRAAREPNTLRQNSPPPPLIRSSAARMASSSSGQAGKKVSPPSVQAQGPKHIYEPLPCHYLGPAFGFWMFTDISLKLLVSSPDLGHSVQIITQVKSILPRTTH